MARDSNGVYSLPPGYLAVTGETIQASQHNGPLEDISAALTGSLPRNGSAPMLANLAMSGKKITGLADGTAAGDAVNKAQLDAVAASTLTVDGVATLTNKTLTQPALTLKQSAAPTPTAEGDVQWDTDDNVLAIGDGAATKLFLPIPATAAAGDLEYFTGAKVKARIAKGTAGQVLQMNAGATAPEWGPPPSPDFAAGNAALGVGTKGTYAQLRQATNAIRAPGYTTVGGNLRYSNAEGGSIGETPAGTWRLMGEITNSSSAPGNTSTWLRIS